MRADPGADFDAAVLGLALPPAVQQALQDAGAARGDDSRVMSALMRAQAEAPDHPAVLIAFYRHYFYGHRMTLARDVARRALVVGARALGLPPVWREVPKQPLAGARDDARTRFFLFVLKGYAYLSLRLDDPVEARDALVLLRALDPEDRVGGSVLEAVRVRALVPADDEAAATAANAREPGTPASVTGAAAWTRAAQGA